ncbi:MAG: hypothetical protein KBF28_05410 [Gemmatimonadales bacterium]|nr:hypothetical protein [Gemmatimonadales bacterium]
MTETKRGLSEILANIERHDEDYGLRYGMVLEAVALARYLGYQSGFRIDPTEPDWPVAYIELPTGQVSWHLPQHPTPWDGHDTATKYERCRAFWKETH